MLEDISSCLNASKQIKQVWNGGWHDTKVEDTNQRWLDLCLVNNTGICVNPAYQLRTCSSVLHSLMAFCIDHLSAYLLQTLKVVGELQLRRQADSLAKIQVEMVRTGIPTHQTIQYATLMQMAETQQRLVIIIKLG